MDKKKVLIISMTVGEGHNTVSKTIKEGLEKAGHEVQIAQLFGYNQKRLEYQNKQYLNACKYIPRLYNFIWHKCRNLNPEKRDKRYVNKQLKKATEYIKGIIDEFKPSVIISTHNYSNTAVNNLIKAKKLDKKIKTIAVLTDYCVHPYWETGILCDYVISPHKVANPELIQKGFLPKQIKTLGYPIASKFSNRIDKKTAREILGIEDKFTIMIMNGGNGLGKNLKLIKTLLKSNKDFQIVCVCGRNQKGKKQIDRYIEKNNVKNVITYGFVSNIEQIMSASDCFFSRGGAVSLTEALNINLPIIIRENMIINEEINKRFFIKQGIALGIEKLSEAKPLIEKLIDNPKILKQIEKNQNKFADLYATDKIVKFVSEL